MSSSNKTPNYKLNQWIGTDTPKREDFNSDNTIIDGALADKANQETGTWTPILKGGVTDPTYTITASTASYSRIGKFVFVRFDLVFTIQDKGSGDFYIGGLPFVSSAHAYSELGFISGISKANIIGVTVNAYTSTSYGAFYSKAVVNSTIVTARTQCLELSIGSMTLSGTLVYLTA